MALPTDQQHSGDQQSPANTSAPPAEEKRRPSRWNTEQSGIAKTAAEETEKTELFLLPSAPGQLALEASKKHGPSQWDVKPPGYENVTAEEAKRSAMFALPGASAKWNALSEHRSKSSLSCLEIYA